MALKDIWADTSNWLRKHKIYRPLNHQPELDEEGLISQNDGIESGHTEQPLTDQNNELIVKAVPQTVAGRASAETIEKLQQGFDKLIERLEGINEHLDRQANQHEDLMNRIQQLPEMLESFPSIVDNQKQIVEKLLDQLKGAAAKNERFVDAVEQIPTQTAKQTDALVNIDHQLAAAADIDVQMSQSFNNFILSLDKLNESTVKHTEGIAEMSKTFSASDTAVSVLLVTIIILTGIIIYLKQS